MFARPIPQPAYEVATKRFDGDIVRTAVGSGDMYVSDIDSPIAVPPAQSDNVAPNGLCRLELSGGEEVKGCCHLT